jgi:hypothetical protein
VAIESTALPFSVGRYSRPNPYEAQVVDHILANLPRRGERTLVVLPTVTAPARRVLSALAQGNPGAARRLVAITGDGIPVNALFRDGEFAWPVRAIPVPLVLFTHTDPLDWDEPGEQVPPHGYALHPPVKPGDVKNSTEDIRLFTLIGAVVARGAFPDRPDGGDGAPGRLVPGPDALADAFRALDPPFFDPAGNRLAGSGEFVVVLRPTPRVEGLLTYPDAVLDAYTRGTGEWAHRHSRPIVQTLRPSDGGGGE